MLIDFRQLFPKYNIKPRGVLHVGANVGEEAPVYDELGIKTVHWIEANHNLFYTLYENTAVRYGHKVSIFAVGDVDGYVNFNVSNNASQSSSIFEFGTHRSVHPEVHYTHTIKVQIHRLDTYFHQNVFKNIDFLNMDIQGAELKALKGMGELLHQFKWAYLEVNKEELYKGCALVGEIDEYLAQFGFKRVETYWVGRTGWGDALYIK